MMQTPGPLVTDTDFVSGVFWVSAHDNLPVATVHGQDEDERQTSCEANARLLTAAYNSYDKHCGERAVECAEGDLLGELLWALEDAVEFVYRVYGVNKNLAAMDTETWRSAIAKARGV